MVQTVEIVKVFEINLPLTTTEILFDYDFSKWQTDRQMTTKTKIIGLLGCSIFLKLAQPKKCLIET